MKRWHTMVQAWRARATARRRARNLRRAAVASPASPASLTRPIARSSRPGRRTGPALPTLANLRAPRPLAWIGAGACLVALAGALVIAGHARRLAVLAQAQVQASEAAPGAGQDGAAFQASLPGAELTIPATAAITLEQRAGAALLIGAGLAETAPLTVDLCSQLAEPARPGGARLLPLRLGYPFADVAAWAARNAAGATVLTPRNVVLATPGLPMPRIEIGGVLRGLDGPLQLRWNAGDGVANVRWAGAGTPGSPGSPGSPANPGSIVSGAAASVMLGRDGVLVWQAGATTTALRLLRRASAACPGGGQLQLQLWRVAAGAVPVTKPARVVAYGAVTQSAALLPGRYRVPARPAPALEDQVLFAQLRAHDLLRLDQDGLISLVPRDLGAWPNVHNAHNAPGQAPAGWERAARDPAARALVTRLYQRADGQFVRAQVDVFNSEQRFLAWRTRAGAAPCQWQARVGGAPAPLGAMPGAGARLFASLPQGWEAWRRIQAWPGGAAAGAVLACTLDAPARAGAILDLMVLGHVDAVRNARLLYAQPACSGRACPAPGALQQLRLAPVPGATRIELSARPLAAGALTAPGDAAYRHIGLASGQLAWRPLATPAMPPPRATSAPVTLVDRHGAVLWQDGAPSAPASAAGLAPLLGYRVDQAGSVAGMLARIGDGKAHAARLSLDLPLQRAASAILDCVGLRRGHWDGARCQAAAPLPAARQAGLVMLDADNGDVLAAAGAGAAPVDTADWAALREFDRLDPARSPLRWPAWQHDGGARRSPGSTFKIISALGLELAARTDPQLERLLQGAPPAALDALAQARGFAFRSDAPSYPYAPSYPSNARARQARITNYGEQAPGRRVVDGRFGLAQALAFSVNTWFAWAGELSDLSLFGRASGGAPDLAAFDASALDAVRPILAMAHRLGFEQALRLDGGLLPRTFAWAPWDALQASAAHIDPVHARHELRQMAIGLRMQATPLQMALAAAAVGQGRVVAPRLLLALDGRAAGTAPGLDLGVRLDRIRAGLRGVIEHGTAAQAFAAPGLAHVRRGLAGKTGTAPTGSSSDASATVWFTGYLEPGSLPGQRHRLAFAVFISDSDATGGAHAAPVLAALLQAMQAMQTMPGSAWQGAGPAPDKAEKEG